MRQIYVKDIINVVEGTLLCGSEECEITDIQTDSRLVKQGDLFVALIGEKEDGHKYLKSAVQQCSACFTMEHDQAEEWMEQSGACVIRVEDTLTAMQRLAAYIKKRYPLPTVGVTGSVGKTTTREMIATALGSGKKVFETIKNYNSQVGVPLTFAKLDDSYEIAVLEMGMSDFGEMERLADMIQPETAVVTCIGVSHIEQLKTKEAIRDEKLQIAKYMTEDDIIYLNGDDPLLYQCKNMMTPKIVWYGINDGCDYRARNIRMEGWDTVFEIITPKETLPVKLKVWGEHNVKNALVAIAVANQYGISCEAAAKALYEFQGQRQRVIKTPYFTMIDDAYNASPDSMKAALSVLRDVPCEGRRIAVLSDMLELGEREAEYHEQVGQMVAESGIDYLIAYGPLSSHIIKKANTPHFYAESIEGIISCLKKEAKPKDVVLFKGSNGMKLSQAVNKFLGE